MVYKLLKLGADPNLPDYNGDTPLFKAIWSTSSNTIDRNEVTNICKELVHYGADVNYKNDNGRSVLFTGKWM